MTTTREFFIKRWESEQRAFASVLRALSQDQLSYQPHDRSAKAGDLAWQLAVEQRCLVTLLDTGKLEWVQPASPGTVGGIADAYDEATNDLRDRLAKADDETWNRPADFIMGGQSLGAQPTGDWMWGFLFDMVHHRGQLSTYIRPMGGKVPAIYGPSGDAQ